MPGEGIKEEETKGTDSRRRVLEFSNQFVLSRGFAGRKERTRKQ